MHDNETQWFGFNDFRCVAQKIQWTTVRPSIGQKPQKYRRTALADSALLQL